MHVPGNLLGELCSVHHKHGFQRTTSVYFFLFFCNFYVINEYPMEHALSFVSTLMEVYRDINTLPMENIVQRVENCLHFTIFFNVRVANGIEINM